MAEHVFANKLSVCLLEGLHSLGCCQVNQSTVIWKLKVVDGLDDTPVGNNGWCLDVLVHRVAPISDLVIHASSIDDFIEDVHVAGEDSWVLESDKVFLR